MRIIPGRKYMWHAITVNAGNDFCNPECIPAMWNARDFMKIVGDDPSGLLENGLMWRVSEKKSKKYIFIMQEYDTIGCEY